jgi:putative DNA primase/helicase
MERTNIAQLSGSWEFILTSLGVKQELLNGKHQACPFCGGTDRFRFSNWQDQGMYYCNQCGSGNGLSFLMKYHKWTFVEALRQVRQVVPSASEPVAQEKPYNDVEFKLKNQRRIINQTVPITPGTPVADYLLRRILWHAPYPQELRYHPSLKYSEGVFCPAMVGVVRDSDWNMVSIHRTFLTPDGMKAEVQSPKKLYPGPALTSAGVYLFNSYTIRPTVVGIAEGIETALGAASLFRVPTIAAICGNLLEKWEIPKAYRDVIQHVLVFGDNDTNYHGQKCAYALAHRLELANIKTTVHIPINPGEDWADVAQRRFSYDG